MAVVAGPSLCGWPLARMSVGLRRGAPLRSRQAMPGLCRKAYKSAPRVAALNTPGDTVPAQRPLDPAEDQLSMPPPRHGCGNRGSLRQKGTEHTLSQSSAILAHDVRRSFLSEVRSHAFGPNPTVGHR